jgi:hypothetical protein
VPMKTSRSPGSQLLYGVRCDEGADDDEERWVGASRRRTPPPAHQGCHGDPRPQDEQRGGNRREVDADTVTAWPRTVSQATARAPTARAPTARRRAVDQGSDRDIGPPECVRWEKQTSVAAGAHARSCCRNSTVPHTVNAAR